HGHGNFNGSAKRVGCAQKPSSRAYPRALSGLRSNAYLGLPGCMDRPRAAVGHSATTQWRARAVLERIGDRWRDDAQTAWRGEISSSHLRLGKSWNWRAQTWSEPPPRPTLL